MPLSPPATVWVQVTYSLPGDARSEKELDKTLKGNKQLLLPFKRWWLKVSTGNSSPPYLNSLPPQNGTNSERMIVTLLKK